MLLSVVRTAEGYRPPVIRFLTYTDSPLPCLLTRKAYMRCINTRGPTDKTGELAYKPEMGFVFNSWPAEH